MLQVRWRTWIVYAAVAVLVAVTGFGLWISRNWPFTREAITRDLQEHFRGRVVIGRFRETWFPPGCVGSDLQVLNTGNSGQAPLMTARDLIIQSTWHGLPARQIAKIKIVGLHVSVPSARGSFKSLFVRDSNSPEAFSSIREVEANEGVLELLPGDKEDKANLIRIHQLTLGPVGGGKHVQFRASLQTGRPVGELQAQGTAGPWKTNDPAATPISGVYQYAHADLTTFKGLKGVLSSDGKFDGDLARIHTGGNVDVPQLHVDGSARSVHLMAHYQATVDAQNADTVLEQVETHVGHTIIFAKGNVAGTHGKTARLDMTVNTGRVEDLLNYFSEEKKPSMTGAVRLRANVELPPGPGFLNKVRLTGDFGVAGGKFTNASRQTPVNDLSESARDKALHVRKPAEEDEPTAVSNLRGHVVVRDGTASLSNVSFEFPGAIAEMAGTFRLIPKTVDIHGVLRTTGSISEATSGFKALMLKVATPFLKKKNTTVVPFAISGTSSNPNIALDLKRKFNEPRP